MIFICDDIISNCNHSISINFYNCLCRNKHYLPNCYVTVTIYIPFITRTVIYRRHPILVPLFNRYLQTYYYQCEYALESPTNYPSQNKLLLIDVVDYN